MRCRGRGEAEDREELASWVDGVDGTEERYGVVEAGYCAEFIKL
jgi:hypothetical protein